MTEFTDQRVSTSSNTHVDTGGSGNAAQFDTAVQRKGPSCDDMAAVHDQSASTALDAHAGNTEVPGDTKTSPPPPKWLQACIKSLERGTQSIMRFNERVESKRRDQSTHHTEQPDSVIARRSIVAVVFVILAWVLLAYVWRLCSRLIEQTPQGRVLGSRSEGLGLLVPFIFLWLMSLWSYIKVLCTGPGLARDYVSESDPPLGNQASGATQSGYQHAESGMNFNHVPIPNTGHAFHAATPSDAPYPAYASNAPYPAYAADIEQLGTSRASNDSMKVLPGSMDPTASVPVPLGCTDGGTVGNGRTANPSAMSSNNEGSTMLDITGQLGAVAAAATAGVVEGRDMPLQQEQPYRERSSVAEAPQAQIWAAPERRPENDPAPFSAAALYCHRCRRIKPPRAHHCRRCGTCVLKMDHHCPWVGGCVGSQNYRFFFIFVLWVTLLELYTLVTTAIFFHRGIKNLGSAWLVDGYLISLFPITAIFGIFTTALLFTHFFLLVHNMTTIEHMGISRVANRERVLVDRWFGMQSQQQSSSIPGSGIKAKRQMIKRWDREWGRLTKEANIWWLGGAHKVATSQEKGLRTGLPSTETAWKANVVQALGSNALLWILPIGHASNIGLDFPVNPRFGTQGVWRKRTDWPNELQ